MQALSTSARFSILEGLAKRRSPLDNPAKVGAITLVVSFLLAEMLKC